MNRAVSSDPLASATHFENAAALMVNRAEGLYAYVLEERKFRALFGVDSETCAVIWDEISDVKPRRGKPKHLLWSLLFLKTYFTEYVLSVITGADPKTLHK